jgi:hypothetical protein
MEKIMPKQTPDEKELFPEITSDTAADLPDTEEEMLENFPYKLQEDTSPVIQKLAVETMHLKDSTHPQTVIVAQIPGPTGILSKRHIVHGGVTANKLAILLKDVAKW